MSTLDIIQLLFMVQWRHLYSILSMVVSRSVEYQLHYISQVELLQKWAWGLGWRLVTPVLRPIDDSTSPLLTDYSTTEAKISLEEVLQHLLSHISKSWKNQLGTPRTWAMFHIKPQDLSTSYNRSTSPVL